MLKLRPYKHYTRLCLLILVFCTSSLARAQGTSPATAAGIGDTVSGIIDCGEGYTSHELYNVKITLLELIRGEQARRLLEEVNNNLPAATAGSDYLLARVSFAYKARTKPGDCIHPLHQSQFLALSTDGVKYESPAIVTPTPALGGPVKSGEVIEGWLVFLVPGTDTGPLLSFNVNDSGAVDHGGNLWFQLH